MREFPLPGNEILRISGSSDDLIHVEYVRKGKVDEFNVISDEPVVATLNIGGMMRVRCLYDGCWTFALAMIDEGEHFSEDWSAWYERGSEVNDYTMILAIEAPEKTKAFLERE